MRKNGHANLTQSKGGDAVDERELRGQRLQRNEHTGLEGCTFLRAVEGGKEDYMFFRGGGVGKSEMSWLCNAAS